MPPDPPITLAVSATGSTANLTWKPSSRDGGSPVTGYVVKARPLGADRWQSRQETRARTATVAGLTETADTEFAVRATNRIGSGPRSATVFAWAEAQSPPPPPPPPPPSPPDRETLATVELSTDAEAPIVDRENYVAGDFQVKPGLSGFAEYTGGMKIRGRGNSTWSMPKKPYRIKLKTKSELLGMPKSRDWVLLANYIDASHLRTATAFKLSEDAGFPWTPRHRYVKVRLNGQALGTYMLVESIKVADDRVEIDEMDEDDITGNALTGGYLLELDGRMEEFDEPGFRTTKDEPIVIKDPDPAEPEQFNYIQNYLQEFEDALFSADFTDPADGYRPYIDLDSFADWYLVAELTRQQDAFFSSVFMHKPRGGTLHMGPLWDFDYSMNHPTASPEGWWVRTGSIWTARLFDDPVFVNRVKQRWAALKPQLPALFEFVSETADYIEPAILDDQEIWNYSALPQHQSGNMNSWLEVRAEWLDGELDAL